MSFKYFGLLIVGFAIFFATPEIASAQLLVTSNATDYTVLKPFERSFRFVLTVENTGSEVEEISFEPRQQQEGDWLNIYPSGITMVKPGDTIEFVTTFEARPRNGVVEPLSIPFVYYINQQREVIDISLRSEEFDFISIEESETITVQVVDSSGMPVPYVEVQFTLWNGLQDWREMTDENGMAYLPTASASALESAAQKNGSLVHFGGYYATVEQDNAYGFVGPLQPGDDQGILTVAAATEAYTYELVNSAETEFSHWWAIANADFNTLITTAGAHPDPNIQPPEEFAIYAYNPQTGTQLWREPIHIQGYDNIDLCWGLDVTVDAAYIGVGCFDGVFRLFNTEGDLVNSTDVENAIRTVAFSADGKYVAYGPTEGQSETVGIFTVPELENVWSAEIGDWARTISFSPDDSQLLVGASNSTLHAFDTETGERTWIGSNGGLVPFLTGFDSTGEHYFTAGKGLYLNIFNAISGEERVRFPVDHVTSYGEISDGGVAVFGTVANTLYSVNADGHVLFRKPNMSIIHNGVAQTRDGSHILVGGNNPTVLDSSGRVMWEKIPGYRQNEMSDSDNMDEDVPEAANAVAVSEDARYLTIGYDDGSIEFWERTGVFSNEAFKADGNEQIVRQENDSYHREIDSEPELQTQIRSRILIAFAAVVLFLGLFIYKKSLKKE